MKQVQYVVFSMFFLFCCTFSQAQQSAATNASTVVPTLVKYSGTLTDINGQPLSGTVGVTFLLYTNDQGGAPLWMETQNVTPDKSGHYTVVLGSTTSQGLPTDLFASGEARWLGVQTEGQAEQPRVLLLSVPYALKAGDAQTVGGLPASAFVLAAPPNAATVAASANPASATAPAVTPLASSDVTTTGGTADTIPMYTTATNVQNSILTQTGTTAINVGGKLNLPATGAATTAAGKNSQPQDFVASSYNSSTKAAVAQTFQLQAEPAGNDTATPSGTLNLLYGSGTATPAETGLKISDKGLITFAAGQAFPGTGSGTVKSVATGTGLTGGPITTTGTLSVDATKVPLLAKSNTFTAEQIINSGGTTPTWSLSINNTSGAAGIVSTAVGAGVGGTTTSSTALGGVEGRDGSATGTGGGVYGYSPSGYGVSGVSPNGTGVVGSATGGTGVSGTSTAGGLGVFGTVPAGGTGVQGTSSSTSQQGVGVWGESQGTALVNGIGSDGVHGVAHSSAGSGVAGINGAVNGTGVWGSSPQGWGFATDSNVSQARSMGGWAKAMVYLGGPTAVTRCFNSQIAASSASTVPCGITVTSVADNYTVVDFGFEIDDRFVMVSFTNDALSSLSYCLSSDGCPVTSTQVYLYATECVSGGDCFWTPVYIMVF